MRTSHFSSPSNGEKCLEAERRALSTSQWKWRRIFLGQENFILFIALSNYSATKQSIISAGNGRTLDEKYRSEHRSQIHRTDHLRSHRMFDENRSFFDPRTTHSTDQVHHRCRNGTDAVNHSEGSLDKDHAESRSTSPNIRWHHRGPALPLRIELTILDRSSLAWIGLSLRCAVLQHANRPNQPRTMATRR